jgi:protocatechuate 3,4-dioxygenase alpha subunit
MPATTPSQTVGPFFSIGLCGRAAGELVDPGSAGALEIVGAVYDGAGEPVADALVEVWQADPDGRYRPDFGWGRSATDAGGGFRFVTVAPGRVPDDEGALQAPHLSVLVFARGLLKPVHTRMYFPEEAEANGEDPLLRLLDPAERASLIAVAQPGLLRFDIRLQGDAQTTFFAL